MAKSMEHYYPEEEMIQRKIESLKALALKRDAKALISELDGCISRSFADKLGSADSFCTLSRNCKLLKEYHDAVERALRFLHKKRKRKAPISYPSPRGKVESIFLH